MLVLMGDSYCSISGNGVLSRLLCNVMGDSYCSISGNGVLSRLLCNVMGDMM